MGARLFACLICVGWLWALATASGIVVRCSFHSSRERKNRTFQSSSRVTSTNWPFENALMVFLQNSTATMFAFITRTSQLPGCILKTLCAARWPISFLRWARITKNSLINEPVLPFVSSVQEDTSTKPASEFSLSINHARLSESGRKRESSSDGNTPVSSKSTISLKSYR